MKTRNLLLLVTIVLLVGATGAAFAQGTAFTYHGRLNDNGSPANGIYDLTFTIYDSTNSPGAIVAGPVTNSPTSVSSGLFTATLDFGAGIFTGADRWLEISLRTNGGGAFTALSPRQKLTPTPYAITASNLTGMLPATQLSGTLPSAQLGGTYSADVTFNNAANSFAGSGAGLTGVDALTLGGFGASSFWRLLGNGGTTPGVNFLGTTDNQPLDLKVNGRRAFRLEPTTDSPNVVGGDSANNVASEAVGATIGGGATNSVLRSFGTVSGGQGNAAGSYAGTVSGGRWNFISRGITGGPGPVASTIGGGSGNQIFAGNPLDGFSDFSTISGGESNIVSFETDHAAVGGGGRNSIGSFASYCSIGGGLLNNIAGPVSVYGTISGGYSNRIIGNFLSGARGATVSGGGLNTASGGIYGYATVGGGQNNIAGGDGYATVGGGQNNVSTNLYATVAGGNANLAGGIGASVAGGTNNNALSDSSSIGGGSGNSISAGDYGTIAGGSANTLGFFGPGTVARYSAVGGGLGNRVYSPYATVAGGADNYIQGGIGPQGSGYSAIGGGNSNLVSFESAYATIGGGNNNNIRAGCGSSYSTIGGGVNNSCGGTYATIGGGAGNLITGDCDAGLGNRYSTIGGGINNYIGITVSGAGRFTIAGGSGNRIETGFNDTGAAIGGGSSNFVKASYGTVAGGAEAVARSYGQMAYASGQFGTPGDAQTSVFVCRGPTTDATLTELFLDGASQRMVVPTNSTWAFDVLVTGRSSSGDSAAYQIRGTIKNNAGTTTVVGAPTFTLLGEDVAAWDASVAADNTNHALVVKVNGEAGTSIRWVASVRTVEVTY